jgi:hypothetical protein
MKDTLLSMLVALLFNLGIAGPDLSYSNLTGNYSKGNELKADTINRNNFRNALMNKFNVKAVRRFERSFENTSDENWYILVDGLIVYFKQNGIQMKAAYDEKGHWLHTLSFYGERDLPYDVRKLVKREYFDYNIYFAVQIDNYEARVFIIKLEDEKTMITVRIWEDEMEEIEKYQKSF